MMYKPRPDPPPPCSLLALNCVPSVNSSFKFALLRPAPLSLTVMRTILGKASTRGVGSSTRDMRAL